MHSGAGRGNSSVSVWKSLSLGAQMAGGQHRPGCAVAHLSSSEQGGWALSSLLTSPLPFRVIVDTFKVRWQILYSQGTVS